MEGQETVIRIVTDKYLPSPHRLYKYTFEVMDEASPYFQNVDYATSHLMLSAGHIYRVVFNDDSANPWIMEIGEELPRSSPPTG